MSRHPVEDASTTPGLPISVGLAPTLEEAGVERHAKALDRRSMVIVLLSIGVAALVAVIARALVYLIGLITNLAFFGKVSADFASPAANTLGLWVIAVPVAGSVIVGLRARYGSKAIRGHGIPEAMEQVLTNESRIPRRMTFLKPLSAAIAIGTGGPFGAEGPIIATGAAIGSWLGQIVHVSAQERKTLLAAGAAAGMTAIFGTPVAAILLAIELLVFEFRPRSFIPVTAATLAAMALRPLLFGAAPLFHVDTLQPATESALLAYVVEGPSWVCSRSPYHGRSTSSRICLKSFPCIGCGGQPSGGWWSVWSAWSHRILWASDMRISTASSAANSLGSPLRCSAD
jgi:chloride channel protein, CIC family